MDMRGLSRWKASGLHLLLSVAIAACVAALVFLVWYPADLVSATGALSLFALLMFVDVTIGPLLTLIVFNPAKKELRRDLSVIAGLQACALAYGLYVVAEARPVYVVFVVDRFEVVSAADLPDEELARVSDRRFRRLPWTGPQYVAAERPADREERSRVMFSSLHGLDLQFFPQYYVPYESQAKLAAKKALPLDQLVKDRPERRELVKGLIADKGSSPVSIGYVPLRSRRSEASVLLRRDSGEILGTLPINPWE